MRSLFRITVLVLLAAAIGGSAGPVQVAAAGHPDRPAVADRILLAEYFVHDPLAAAHLVHSGAGLDRAVWERDAPAWRGDRPGSLTATYDSDLPAGWFGFELGRSVDQDSGFSAAMVFVIRSEGFLAQPDGFFQISWGLWNSLTTGLDRTGDVTDFAGDTFELLELDWFPNVSPFFGGPYLSPSLFGVADPENPAFPFSGAFANASFTFGPQIELPFDEPLLALIEHRPDIDSAAISVHRVVGPRATVPLPGAVAVVDLSLLNRREYLLDAVGLTLWHDGFGGTTPALQAQVQVHSIIVRSGFFKEVEDALRVPPRPRLR